MEKHDKEAIDVISKKAGEIITGDYSKVDEIYQYCDCEKNDDSIVELVESFGMMSVKLEARELALENTIEELKDKNEELKKSMKIRENFNYLFLNVVFVLCFISFLVAVISSTNFFRTTGIPTAVVSRIFEIITIVICVIFIKKSGLPLSDFGLTLKNTPRALKEAAIATVISMAAIISIKYSLILLNIIPDQKVLEFSRLNYFYAIYFGVAILQEFISRGVMLSTIYSVTTSSNPKFWAIIISSLLFGTSHLHISVTFAFASIIGGLLWGYLYLRTKNLVGISISHFLIGSLCGLMGMM
jgi:membrane protease YdiL (CAAX protease family)